MNPTMDHAKPSPSRAKVHAAPATTKPAIDRMDIIAALVVGIAAAGIKVCGDLWPDLHVTRYTTDATASVLTISYILWRVQTNPERLRDWGITTPLTPTLLFAGFLLLVTAVASLAAISIALGVGPAFKPGYISEAIEYLLSAFPQQFFLCSVGLLTLSRLPLFQGSWRLPLAVGLAFSLAHFWTPSRVPGIVIPFQMLLTFPMGFVAAYYFLKFRSILPLIAIHAIVYPLLVDWIERHF